LDDGEIGRMNPDRLFPFVNAIILIGWLPLFFAPRWKGTRWLMYSCAVPMLLAAMYVILMIFNISHSPIGIFTLEQVSQFLHNRSLLLAAWIHFGAMDLFVAYWEVNDAQRSGIPHLLMVPCLLLTLFFGPAGLLSYLIVRRTSAFTRSRVAQRAEENRGSP
jgi:hypothetical protein